jgi:hypothetical protein
MSAFLVLKALGSARSAKGDEIILNHLSVTSGVEASVGKFMLELYEFG